MVPGRKLPEDPLAFIRGCILGRRLLWTYHVNMRLAGRHITRDEILAAAQRYELVESYPDDKYLPSYLVADVQATGAFHVLFAVDVEADHVTVVTAYRPHPDEWAPDMKTRRTQS